MYPSFTIFNYEITSYSILVILGIAAAGLYLGWALRGRSDYSSVQIVNIPVCAGVGAFLGAHIVYGITHLDTLWWMITNPTEAFADLITGLTYFIEVFGGMVFYGGLIGGIIGGYIYCRHMKLDYQMYADIYAPAIPLFHVFGRIGCFLGGCCYGVKWAWGFVYTNAPIESSNGVVRLPIQLIEAGLDFVIFLVLAHIAKRGLAKGIRLELYLIIYPIVRFCTEFFRGDEIRGHLWLLSTSQWISLGLFTVAVVRIL